jgi:hypothetical protein
MSDVAEFNAMSLALTNQPLPINRDAPTFVRSADKDSTSMAYSSTSNDAVPMTPGALMNISSASTKVRQFIYTCSADDTVTEGRPRVGAETSVRAKSNMLY